MAVDDESEMMPEKKQLLLILKMQLPADIEKNLKPLSYDSFLQIKIRNRFL
jgi:hypothetical protein